MAELRDRLLAEDWDAVIAATPDGGSGLFLLSYAGHVGLGAEPLHTTVPALPSSTPSNCTGSRANLQTALAQAIDEERLLKQPASQRLAQARRFLDSRPWPSPPPGYADPTRAEADAEMTRRYRDFLARPPYQRHGDHEIVIDSRTRQNT
ncbi:MULTISPECIES: hypothetical protein [Streptosporangium]|uniref:Uncharacterized protein n=1 Tax=Streptosporangium roseum (strain ATCC 12428 / DSM 43021 / JCM 3005 / KCTC 9067 / NCIMB 10171 / NRRL 2505 / NI 9100) TaxID=479432 RepID=D2AW58_STRRD|nr:hypothetical protein [Streptosporangium roseum]ACZ85011.1 hypothetical protein Sros_2023 [Streptosporangium roseum DSM 43021]